MSLGQTGRTTKRIHTCKKCKREKCGKKPPTECKKCGGTKFAFRVEKKLSDRIAGAGTSSSIL